MELVEVGLCEFVLISLSGKLRYSIAMSSLCTAGFNLVHCRQSLGVLYNFAIPRWFSVLVGLAKRSGIFLWLYF